MINVDSGVGEDYTDIIHWQYQWEKNY